MSKIYKNWRRFLFEANEKTEAYDFVHHPEDIERARIGIAVAFDRAVLAPKLEEKIKQDILKSSTDDDVNPEDPATWRHITKLKDIVAKGRQVPFLYYAYRGVNPETGRLMDGEDFDAAKELTGAKVLDFLGHFSGNKIAKDTLISDFSKMRDNYGEFKQSRSEYLAQQGVVQDSETVRADAGKHSIGPEMSFSINAIGAGSKPVSFVNQDFMYKDTPEKYNIPDEHHFLFSPYFPLALTVLLLNSNITPSSVSELYKTLDKYNIDLGKVYDKAVEISEEYQKAKRVPPLSSYEFTANYIYVTTVGAYEKSIKDAQEELNKPERAILQGSDLSTFLLKFRLLSNNSKQGINPDFVTSKYKELAAMLTAEVRAEILYLSNVYPRNGLPQIKPNQPPPPKPKQFPDSNGNTLADIVERAEDFHFLYPRIKSELFEMIPTDVKTEIEDAHTSLESKGLNSQTNPNSSEYQYGPPMRVIRSDWYETVYTEEEFESIGSGSARPRDVQQRDRRTSKAVQEYLVIINNLLKQEDPDLGQLESVQKFIAKLQKNLDQKKITFRAFPEGITIEDMIVSVETINKKIASRKEALSALREVFRRFL